MFRRTLGQPVLFAIIYTVVAAALYFSLGVAAGRALGLTPVVFLVAGVFFLLAGMAYGEGASLHQDRGGATVFARYAFNELVSFVAGWVMVLDYVILLSVTAFTATHYLAAFWAPLGRGKLETIIALGILAWVAWRSIRGLRAHARAADLGARDARHRAPGDRRRPRRGRVLRRRRDHRHDPPRLDPDVGRRVLRRRGRHRRVHRPRVGLRPVGRAARRPPRAEAADRLGDGLGARALRRRRRRRDVGAAGRRQRDLAGAQLPRGPDGGRRRGVPPALVLRPAQVRHRGRRHRDTDRRRGLGDARALAAVVCALDEPPDPERARPPAPAARHAVRRDRARRGDRRRADPPPRPRLPRGPLRVRRPARADDRAPVDRRAALPRAGAQAAVPDAAVGARGRRRAADPGRARRRARGARVGERRRDAQRGALGRPRLARGRARVLRRLPQHAGQAAAQARRRAGGGAARRAPRRRVRLDPRADLRQPARRRHRPDRGPARGRGGRRVLRGGPRRDDRGALGLRGPDVAADRRRPAQRAAQARAGGPGAREGGGRGVRGRRGGHRDGARAPGRAGDRRRGATARRAGDRARRRGAVEDPRRGAARRPRRPARQLRRRGDEVRDRQGAVPGDPHRAARERDAGAQARAGSRGRRRRRPPRRAARAALSPGDPADTRA